MKCGNEYIEENWQCNDDNNETDWSECNIN